MVVGGLEIAQVLLGELPVTAHVPGIRTVSSLRLTHETVGSLQVPVGLPCVPCQQVELEEVEEARPLDVGAEADLLHEVEHLLADGYGSFQVVLLFRLWRLKDTL